MPTYIDNKLVNSWFLQVAKTQRRFDALIKKLHQSRSDLMSDWLDESEFTLSRERRYPPYPPALDWVSTWLAEARLCLGTAERAAAWLRVRQDFDLAFLAVKVWNARRAVTADIGSFAAVAAARLRLESALESACAASTQ